MPPQPDPSRFAYADAGRILAETLDAILPANRMSVADHAAQHRWVKSTVGAHLERWDHETAYYLREPMEWLSSDQYDTIAIVGPGACGKTMIAENWLLYTIESDPADLLWYLNADAATESYVKGRIEPLLDQHERLIGHLRHGRDSVGFKRFRGGRAEFLTFTASTVVNKHVSRIVFDEVDNADDSMGDPLSVLNPRRQAALEMGADSKLLLISHPDRGVPIDAPRDRQRGIMAVYTDSTRCTWWWRCPNCGAHSSPHPGTARRMVLDWPKDAPLDVIEREARLICPSNGCLITDHERRAMNRTGRWIGAGEEIDEDGHVTGERLPVRTAGAWILGVMSPFTKGGLGGLARARAAAERKAEHGDDADLRTVIVKTWGEPYAQPKQVGSVDAAVLAERAEPDLRLGTVPAGVRFLTAWADAQGNRFELIVRGWGAGRESWVVDHQVIPAEPSTNAEDWDDLLERLAETAYPLADGSGRAMKIRAAGFDSQGQAGVTEQAFAAWLRRRKAHGVKRYGQVEGRDVWSLVPTKGASGPQAPRIQLVYPNSQRKDRKSTAKGQVPLLLFNPNGAKDALAAQLAIAPPATGAVHFPAALRNPAGPPHPFFEQLSAEARNPATGRWAPVENGRRNEVLDMMVGCELVARLHGLHRIAWDAAPPWAAPWDSNSLVVTQAVEDAEAAEAPARIPAPPVVIAAAAQGRGRTVVGVGRRLG